MLNVTYSELKIKKKINFKGISKTFTSNEEFEKLVDFR